jgi:rhodanese-related sulfurtransferase
MPTTAPKKLAISAADYFAAKLAYEMTPFSLKGLLVDKRETSCGLKPSEVLVLDVRSTEDYAKGHIPGAKNIPLADLPAKLSTLPKDKTLVTYCGNITCALAPKAAYKLAEAGFTNVMELFGGIQTWQDKGFPIEK